MVSLDVPFGSCNSYNLCGFFGTVLIAETAAAGSHYEHRVARCDGKWQDLEAEGHDRGLSSVLRKLLVFS